MKLFETLKIKDKEYKLRLSAGSVIELEEKLGCGILEGLSKISSLKVCLLFLWASLQKFNSGVTLSDVNGIWDEYVDNGGSMDEMSNTIFEVLVLSGFIKAEVLEQGKQMQEKLQDQLQEQLQK